MPSIGVKTGSPAPAEEMRGVAHRRLLPIHNKYT
jgi:hypothetical protein